MEQLELFNYLLYLVPLLGFMGSGSGTSGDPYIVTNRTLTDITLNSLEVTV